MRNVIYFLFKTKEKTDENRWEEISRHRMYVLSDGHQNAKSALKKRKIEEEKSGSARPKPAVWTP